MAGELISQQTHNKGRPARLFRMKFDRAEACAHTGPVLHNEYLVKKQRKKPIRNGYRDANLKGHEKQNFRPHPRKETPRSPNLPPNPGSSLERSGGHGSGSLGEGSDASGGWSQRKSSSPELGRVRGRRLMESMILMKWHCVQRDIRFRYVNAGFKIESLNVHIRVNNVIVLSCSEGD